MEERAAHAAALRRRRLVVGTGLALLVGVGLILAVNVTAGVIGGMAIALATVWLAQRG